MEISKHAEKRIVERLLWDRQVDLANLKLSGIEKWFHLDDGKSVAVVLNGTAPAGNKVFEIGVIRKRGGNCVTTVFQRRWNDLFSPIDLKVDFMLFEGNTNEWFIML